MLLYLFRFFVLFICILSLRVYANDTAGMLFEKSSPMVFQIKVIDKVSGNKAMLGSGFQVSPTGVIATNYHVVSEYLLDRDKYSIEVLDHNNNTIQASIINFEIVHDLALLQANGLDTQTLKLSEKPLAHGNRIYSMGNPNDLGMTIIEGTYNGLVAASRYKRYLFSGSLNSGMSGGPVFNSLGEVIGINVSKGGEQLSFLVPVRHLGDLMSQGYEPIEPGEYNAHSIASLLKDQDAYYTKLVDAQWLTKGFQKFELPDKIDGSLKCWGHSEQGDNSLFDEAHRHCKTEDDIFIKSGFTTGSFNFSYESITSSELNTIQFYKLLEKSYALRNFSNNYDKEETTNFVCMTDFLSLGDESDMHNNPWKVTACIREYINYAGLYDAGLIAVYADSAEGNHDGLIITMNNMGIDKNNIKKLHNKFMDVVKWER